VQFHLDFQYLFFQFLNDHNAYFLRWGAAFADAWQRRRDNQHSLDNPTRESIVIVPDSITRSSKLRTKCELQRAVSNELGMPGIASNDASCRSWRICGCAASMEEGTVIVFYEMVYISNVILPFFQGEMFGAFLKWL
jgi:hypothetical protein